MVASNDDMTIGAARAFWQAGIKIPEDISLLGFDDIPVAASFTPSLTTVQVPVAEMIKNTLDGDTVVPLTLFDGNLIVRESVKPGPWPG